MALGEVIDDHAPFGRLFMAYLGPNEDYDPAIHAREDELVRNVTLRVKENDFWAAEIVVEDFDRGLAGGSEPPIIVVSVERNGVVEPFFIGRVRTWPVGSPVGEMTIEAWGVPYDIEAAKLLAVGGERPNGYNPDIYGIMSKEYQTPEKRLSAGLNLIHWSRYGRAPRVVSMIGGDRIVDVGDNYVLGTMQYSKPNDPLTFVDVEIKAQFRQIELHEVELGYGRDEDSPGIGDKDGIFGTLVWPDWQRSLPELGSKIGDWNVVDVQVRYADTLPAEAGGSRYTQAFAGDVKANRDVAVGQDEGAVALVFQRNFVQVRLKLVATRNIRRTERLRFRVAWAGQPFADFTGKGDVVRIDCDNLQIDTGTVPEWQPNTFYRAGAQFSYDDFVWLWDEDGVTADEFYKDYDRLTPQPIDFSPMRGPTSPIFFGQPKVMSGVNTPNGGQLIIRYDPTPAETTVAYGYGQAVAKLALSARNFLSFEVPLEYVFDCEGTEVIRVAGPDVKGGVAFGKITEMTLSIGDAGCLAKVTIAPIAGSGVGHVAPVIPPYLPARVPYAGTVSADVVNDFLEQEYKLSLVQYPAINPGRPLRVGELSSGEVADPNDPKGYDLSSYVESDDMKTKLDVVMSPMRGQLDREALIVPTNGANGVFYYGGPKNIDLT
jgi:hypothetical protein